jgi:hypothetical protein
MKINVGKLFSDRDLGGGVTFTRMRPVTTMAGEGEAANSYPETTLTGLVQPAATFDRVVTREGVRIADVQAFYTSTSGDISPGASGQNPDLLKYQGLTYRVLHVQDFDGHGMVRALAQLIQAGGTDGT